MSSSKPSLSRRDFLKIAGLGMGALALRPRGPLYNPGAAVQPVDDFPQGDLLGRNCTADTSLQWGGTVPILSRPDVTSEKVRDAHRDEVFTWLRECAGETIDYNISNQRWVETPEGYIRSNQLQPCRNQPNTPLTSMPAGQSGFWAEVTVPYVDLALDNPAPVSGWMRDMVAYDLTPRLYYAQVMWIDDVRTRDNLVEYHVNERYGNPGDLFWADGTAFRPLTEEDVSPIHPDVDPTTKKIVVNLNYQSLSCLEEDREVYFCRVSTGIQEGSTALGEHPIARKLISVRMAANTAGSSYDLPGISWTSIFDYSKGLAIHAATSHNDFGTVRSHGCVNCRPEDAKWVFRWGIPAVSLEPGDVLWQDWTKGSTHVFVVNTL